jgi:transposase
MKKTYKTYSEEFKWEVVQLYLEGSGTLRSIAEHYNIPSKETVRKWVNQYEAEGRDALEEKRGKSERYRTGGPRKKPLSLEERVTKLQAENDFLKKLLAQRRR